MKIKNEIQDLEVWKDIKGYEGLYQVSNLGRVKSLERIIIKKNGKKQTIRERILKPKTEWNGYLRITLANGSGKKKSFFVHRIVCEAFHENPEDKPCVNHIDENKTNNVASNLEWCTVTENINHGTRNARVGEAVAKALSKPVGQYTLDGKLIKIWQSTIEVERRLGFAQGNISKVAQGKQKTAYGYVWKYIEEGSNNLTCFSRLFEKSQTKKEIRLLKVVLFFYNKIKLFTNVNACDINFISSFFSDAG